MYLLPVLAGFFFGIVGLGYRLGQARGITTPMVVLYLAVAGCLYFGLQLRGAAFGAPPLVWTLGVAAGLAQYACIELVGAALKRGPLSPIWCALNLIFVPVIIYSAVFLGEAVDTLKVLGIGAAIGSVVCGSIRSGSASAASTSVVRVGPYLVILVGALLFNAVLHGSIKHLNHGGLMDAYGNLFFFVTYAMIGLPIVIKLSIKGFGPTFSRAGVGAGCLAAFGSVAGFTMLAASAHFPAATVFTLSAILSLVTGSLISVTFFKEKITGPWLAMMALAVVSVVLVGVHF